MSTFDDYVFGMYSNAPSVKDGERGKWEPSGLWTATNSLLRSWSTAIFEQFSVRLRQQMKSGNAPKFTKVQNTYNPTYNRRTIRTRTILAHLQSVVFVHVLYALNEWHKVCVVIIIIILIIITKTMSSWQSHCESSTGSFDECKMAPCSRRPKTKPDDLCCESACTGCQKLHPPSPFIIITQPENWYSFYRPTEGRRLSRPILVLTGSDVAQLRWSKPTCYWTTLCTRHLVEIVSSRKQQTTKLT